MIQKTSRNAYILNQSKLLTNEQLVRSVMKNLRLATAGEVWRYLYDNGIRRMKVTDVRYRMSELKEKGLIADTLLKRHCYGLKHHPLSIIYQYVDVNPK